MNRDDKLKLLQKLEDESKQVAGAVRNLQLEIWADDPPCLYVAGMEDVVHGANGRVSTFCGENIGKYIVRSNNKTRVITCKKCLEKMTEMHGKFIGDACWAERIKKLEDACFPPVDHQFTEDGPILYNFPPADLDNVCGPGASEKYMRTANPFPHRGTKILHVGEKKFTLPPGTDYGPTPTRNCDTHYVPFIGIDFGVPEGSESVLAIGERFHKSLQKLTKDPQKLRNDISNCVLGATKFHQDIADQVADAILKMLFNIEVPK